MTEIEFKYWAFLCFSPLDNAAQRPDAAGADHLRWADRLHEALQSFAVPAEFIGQPNSRGEIIPARIDAIYQPAPAVADAGHFSEAERLALESSRCLIVICSPRAAHDARVNEMVRHFKQLGRGNRILPLVIAGEPNASDGSKPGAAPEAECFVPALLHPVTPDGSLDATRREAGYFFADARYGADRSEISARTELLGETEQAIAKIHLISGVLGVGFYGLWQREQKRRFIGFAEVQQQVREVQSQFEFARDQAQSAQAQLQALQTQARETLSQLEVARQEVRAAQDRLLANQNVPLDLQTQIREAQNQARDAQHRSQAMQNQLEALQAQARASQEQLDAARQQVQSAEQKSLEAQQQVRISQAQVEQARQQARATQQQLEVARQQLREAQEKALAVQAPAPAPQASDLELQNQLRAAEEQARTAQAQVEAALARAQALEASLATAQSQAREAQQQGLEFQNQITAAQQRAKAAQDEVAQIRNQTQEVQVRIDEAQKQMAAAENQTRATRAELAALQKKVRASQRLTKVFAVLAVLAALAAGVMLSQRNASKAELAQRNANETLFAPVATNQLDTEQIRQGLLQARGLDSFVDRIPVEKIAETLNLAATILTEPQYHRLEDQLLAAWIRTNAPAAFEWGRQLTNASLRVSVLARTIPALAADSPARALMAFDWLQNPTNSEALPASRWRDTAITGLFRNWAMTDLEAAATASEQLSEAALKAQVSALLLSQRINSDPAAAVGFVTNLPPGDMRQKAIVALSERWGGVAATNALAWAETLPTASDRTLSRERILSRWASADLPGVTNWLAGLPDEIRPDALRLLAKPWAQQDASGLAAYAFSLPGGEVQSLLLTEASRAMATNDFAAVVEVLQPLTNNVALRLNLLEQAAGSDPRVTVTAEYLATMTPGEDQHAAIKGLIASWSGVAPEAALGWLRAFPETNAQPAQVEFVLRSWAQAEPAAAAQWLANQPVDKMTETMFLAYLDGAVVKYPEFAAQWTQAVTDETQRQKLQAHLAKEWLQRDALAAQQWIETLDMPARLKRMLK